MEQFGLDRPLILATGASLTLPTLESVANYSFTNIADTSGPFDGFGVPEPSINAAGTVAFWADLDGPGSGIFTGNGGPPSTIADTFGGDLDGPYGSFDYGPSVNATGTVAVSAFAAGQGMFIGSGGAVTIIAHTSGPPTSFTGNPAINSGGTVAFYVSGLDGGGQGVFTGNGGPTTIIAESTGPFSIFGGEPSINDAGTVAFFAGLDAGGQGIFTGSGAAVTTIANSTGPFNMFGSIPDINSSGTVAFGAVRDNGIVGIFTGSGGAVTTIADSTGPFDTTFYTPAINNMGSVVFRAELDAGGFGIFIGPDLTAEKVIRTGDPLFGSTVTDLGFVPDINDNGEIAFGYRLASGISGIAAAQVVLPADFNNDGTVDAADYVVWRNGLGTTYDENDYGVWRTHFGASLGPGSGSALPSAESLSAAVPEPATLILMTLAVVGWCLGRRRGL